MNTPSSTPAKPPIKPEHQSTGFGFRFSLRMAFFWITVFGIVLAYQNAFNLAPVSKKRILFKQVVGNETFMVREVPIASGLKARSCYATVLNSYQEVVKEKTLVIAGALDFKSKSKVGSKLLVTFSSQSDASIECTARFDMDTFSIDLFSSRNTKD